MYLLSQRNVTGAQIGGGGVRPLRPTRSALERGEHEFYQQQTKRDKMVSVSEPDK